MNFSKNFGFGILSGVVAKPTDPFNHGGKNDDG
jgi:hypothetical protein